MCFVIARNITAFELFKSFNEYFAKKLNWSFCVGVCTNEAAAMIGRLSGLTVQIKEVSPECEATHCHSQRNAGELKNIT